MKPRCAIAAFGFLALLTACGAHEPAPTSTVVDPLLNARDSVQPRIEAAESAHKAALEKAETDADGDSTSAR